ncbi:peptide chain release factor N(5)-glutamine methyltransferase [Rubrivivax gelatinosus]|uniref:Release factor glutamine methyltransferase n=1 Tax=Rubrivivax gelatinosus TaxID=28068 RepID=A0ABS1DV09_RUBGE|nr:peptide chain release factor N(5)-glutamine methyltransferase [Rubrivivax gelatinosus]MBK1712607.1 protein-(glutamine-N5) methyltransferase, release factor-specific [Rubrivivax gelatinosus]
MRIREALAAGRELGVDRLDTQLLLAHRLQRTRAWLLAHDDDALEPPVAAQFGADLARRAAGVPLAYIVGEREFHGLALQVTPAVLVPRPDTEVLVDWALELLPPEQPAQVLDLGTGSGAIALAVKHARPAVTVVATDVSEAALAVAAANAKRLALEVDFVAGAWWQPLAGRRFDLVLSNPPYIAGDDEHLPALRHEPRGALTPEGDGLDALRQIVAGAPAQLVPGGWLLLEHGYDQAEAVQALLLGAGFTAVTTRHDLGTQPRCTGGCLPR